MTDFDANPIFATNDMTKEQFMKFQRFHATKGKGVILFSVLGVLLLIPTAGFIYFFIQKDYFTVAGMGAILALFAWLLLQMFFLRPATEYKKAKISQNAHVDFEFKNEAFTVTSQSAMASGSDTISYKAIHRVYECQGMFYIYLSPSKAIVLETENVAEGRVGELRNLLWERLGSKKYKMSK